ncbi:hypothetical protein AMS68_002681 [Peltaster fructicola]|uniref:Uncharacterized protein n=1 Tax=Peltaster fructicola TaxID=286661 RepID=A0A6H0XR07_9PEZI|nr:hypothetical protein AMS68_002681 [Peltaster fructicola]
MSLAEKLDKIRSSPKLESQQQTAVVLKAVDDTLKEQKSERSPTAYLAALLSLLPKGGASKDVEYAIIYLLDLVTEHVPGPILKSKFPQILSSIAPSISRSDAEAPLLRAVLGTLESLLLAQDAAAWALPQSPDSPRGAVGALLGLALDQRPKVRKRALDALKKVLTNPPPSPSIDHPTADMAAETALRSLQAHASKSHNDSGLMHALQLVKAIAAAERGWPSRKMDALCEILFNISRGSSEFLTMTAFEIFEIIFAGLADEVSSAKLPNLLSSIQELKPSKSDSQLLPPWLAVLSRGYDVSAQLSADETFTKLPEIFKLVAGFLSSSHHNVRISAAECMTSLLNNCIPNTVILEPSIMDEKILEKIVKVLNDVLTVKYQAAWMEVFSVLSAAFEVLKWQSTPWLNGVVKTIGELRSNDAFAGKKEADTVLAAAVHAMGPESVLAILPLNLQKPAKGQAGRAWLLPVIRDAVSNTNLAHFRAELVPLSQVMFQRVLDHGAATKTMDIKIFETVVNQIWSCLPGYCQLPLDLRSAFDQSFAETLSNILYQQPHLRTDVCKALQNLVDTNKAIAELETDEDLVRQGRVSKQEAQLNLDFLAAYSSNLLAILFNVYSQTLPQNRGNLLQCINAFLSITPAAELMETFQRVATMLEAAILEQGPQTQADKQKEGKDGKLKMPPTSHTLMDLVITMSVYLPRDCFSGLFTMAANVVQKKNDPQLQKKAYKLVPRLAESEIGRQAIVERNTDLQQLFLASAEHVSSPAKRDRLMSIAEVVSALPQDDLHFIPAIIPEVVIGVKEVNEGARLAAFDLLVLMGQKMSEGGTVIINKVPKMPEDAAPVSASIEEYFTMVSAGLAGATPHMISATITALTRLLFEYKDQLREATVAELVQTMDLFLTSNDREIVRSVLGFVKVCVISLPSEIVLPRLETLIPNLILWSHEHKQHFKAKVKHIFERMIRRFGAELIEKNTPEADRKLITNIRKTRERRKRKKLAEDEEEAEPASKGKFESGYDEAVYGSDSESQEGSDISDDEVLRKSAAKGQRAKTGRQYIVEDEDEPLDLLDKRALAHVSSTKPVRAKAIKENSKKAKRDLDGKLVFNESDDDVMQFDDQGMINGNEPGDGTLEGGINAYVDALKSRDAPTRGQRGKLKFKQKGGPEDDEMEVDEKEVLAARQKASPQHKHQRRGLGMDKQKGMPGRQGVRKTPNRPIQRRRR